MTYLLIYYKIEFNRVNIGGSWLKHQKNLVADAKETSPLGDTAQSVRISFLPGLKPQRTERLLPSAGILGDGRRSGTERFNEILCASDASWKD